MKIKHIVGFSVIAVIVIFFIVANCILFNPTMSNIISAQLCPPVTIETFEDDDEVSAGQEVAKRIMEEGAVLVKNDGVLPLSVNDDKNVNLFGRASTDWLYSGSGSGQVRPEENDSSTNIDLAKALSNYGISCNNELASMYRRFLTPQGYGGAIGGGPSYYKIADPDIDDKNFYSDSLLNGALAHSKTAFVVIGRRAGESTDPTKYQQKYIGETDYSRHYLEISTEEEKLLRYVGQNYQKVIVIINSLNVMELGFLDTIPGIDACLIVGGTGTRAASAIPGILYGDVSPSGHLTDTYAYAMEDHVNFNHVGFDGIVYYENAEGLYPDGTQLNSLPTVPTGPYYIDYIDGIYVGYKWFETADEEGIWNGRTLEVLDPDDSGKSVIKNGYDAVVQYPFGYGLSYNEFTWEIRPEMTTSDFSGIGGETEIQITVRVTNVSGDRPAKDVVQLYMTPPYHKGQIEKSSAVLVAFAKTGDIDPGQYEDVTLTLTGYELASYDCYDLNKNNNTGYEIDSGDYKLSLRTDSHHDKEGCDPITFNVPSTVNIKNDTTTTAEVDNLFTGNDAVDGVSVDGLGEAGGNQNVAYITRANFPTKAPERAAARDIPDIVREYNLYTKEDSTEWNNAVTDAFGNKVDNSPVTFDAKNGLSVYDAANGITELGKKLGNPENYEDPDWDKLLDQLNRSQALTMIGISAAGTPAVSSVGKPTLQDRDGPVQAGGFVNMEKRGVGFPSAFVLAQSWSEELALRFGVAFGQEMQSVGFAGIFGPGCNIHRNPFGGRNFEYYSEDGFLSGKIAANSVYGMKTEGRYAFLKHYAAAETETGRDSYYSWMSEQALREIYVKPFEIAVKEGGCVGIMSSYNRVGARWAGGSVGLQEGLLRNEWGFRGAIITDFSDHNQYMNMNESIRMGGDLGMSTGLTSDYDNTGNRLDHEIRQAVKNVLYMWLNAEYTASTVNLDYVSSGSLGEPWIWWHPLLIDLTIIAFASCAFWAFLLVLGILKNRKAKLAVGKEKAAATADNGSEGGKGND